MTQWLDFLAAILDARVAADDLVLEPQHEVIDRSLPPDQERVALGRILLGGVAGDRAVLDAPELRVAVPAVEVLAVEDRLEARLVVGERQPSEPIATQQRQRDEGKLWKRCMGRTLDVYGGESHFDSGELPCQSLL